MYGFIEGVVLVQDRETGRARQFPATYVTAISSFSIYETTYGDGMKDIDIHYGETYLRLKQVLEIIPVSRSTWYRGVKAGTYPKSVKLSRRAVGWKSSEIWKCLAQLEDM